MKTTILKSLILTVVALGLSSAQAADFNNGSSENTTNSNASADRKTLITDKEKKVHENMFGTSTQKIGNSSQTAGKTVVRGAKKVGSDVNKVRKSMTDDSSASIQSAGKTVARGVDKTVKKVENTHTVKTLKPMSAASSEPSKNAMDRMNRSSESSTPQNQNIKRNKKHRPSTEWTTGDRHIRGGGGR